MQLDSLCYDEAVQYAKQCSKPSEFQTKYGRDWFEITLMTDGTLDSIRTVTKLPAYWHCLDELTGKEKKFRKACETMRYSFKCLWEEYEEPSFAT